MDVLLHRLHRPDGSQ